MELIIAFLTAKITAYVGGSIAVFVVAWILKKIPNEKIKMVVGEFFYKFGVLCTLGLSRYRYTKKVWNKIIEPWFIDLIDNVIGESIKQFILGLRSDNKEE